MTDNMALATYDDVARFGQAMVASGFFKTAQNEAQAIVQIMAGRELGIGPVEALRGIYIVDGKLALTAGLVGAQIKRSRRYNYRVLVQEAKRCELSFTEDGQAAGTVSYTIEEAQAAGLTNKDNWKKYPADMLFARALTRGARRFCPDVFGGAVYSPEEVRAAGSIEGELVVDQATGEVRDAEAVMERGPGQNTLGFATTDTPPEHGPAPAKNSPENLAARLAKPHVEAPKPAPAEHPIVAAMRAEGVTAAMIAAALLLPVEQITPRVVHANADRAGISVAEWLRGVREAVADPVAEGGQAEEVLV